ncbi:VOC family protein [Kribbella sp. NPDC051952]|uniref:VOC family protein n=1 Tax=Kribbella sp. NPDC051952 TaxID=3154851 RepID=UPI00344A8AD1
MTNQVGDWREFEDGASVWYDAPSQAAGAALITRIAEAGQLPDIDLRASGLRIRIGSDAELARTTSEAAQDLGLTANPAALQELRLVIAAADPASVRDFWRTALAYQPAGDDGLADPLRRDPALAIHPLSEPQPLRNRIHVDVVRNSAAVQDAMAALKREPIGPYGVGIADDEGNEIDLVPGDEFADASDWWTVFSAMTFYPTTSAAQASQLATAVAGLSDDAGVPILVDLRPSGVTLDSGKDLWENDEGAPRPEFVALATEIQAAARSLGLTADPSNVRFMQFGIDAVDIPAVRAFWATLLGYEPDPREFLSDLNDPRRLNPVLFFQTLDPADPRRHERARIRLELAVPEDQVEARISTAIAAGGRLLEGSRVADPEGNEVEIVARP